MKESFIRVENGEVYIYGMHISPYEKGNIFNKDPMRVRKLLLHRYEINKIEGSLQEKGLSLVIQLFTACNSYFKFHKTVLEIYFQWYKSQAFFLKTSFDFLISYL